MHPLHVLTPLTGKEAAEKRTVVIGTVELNWRLFVVLASASLPAIILTAFTWPFLSQYAVLVFPSVLIAASLLFYRRSNKGMRLRTYQAFLDKKRARDVGQFYLCGEPIDIAPTHFKSLLQNTAPYAPGERQLDPLVATAAVFTKQTRRGDGHTYKGALGRGDEMAGTRSLRDLAPRRRHHHGEDTVVPPVLPETPSYEPVAAELTDIPAAAPVQAPVQAQAQVPPHTPAAVQQPAQQAPRPAPVAVMERPAPVAAPAPTHSPAPRPTAQPVAAPAPQPVPQSAPVAPVVTATPAPAPAPIQSPAPAVPQAYDALAERTPDGDYAHDDIDPAVFFDSSAPGRRKRA